MAQYLALSLAQLEPPFHNSASSASIIGALDELNQVGFILPQAVPRARDAWLHSWQWCLH